jgi:hypothetical protein
MSEFDYTFRLVITKEQWLNDIGLALNDTEYEIFWYRSEEEDSDEEEEWIVATEGMALSINGQNVLRTAHRCEQQGYSQNCDEILAWWEEPYHRYIREINLFRSYGLTLLPEIMVNEKQNAMEISRMNSIHNAIKDHMLVVWDEPEWKKYMGLSSQPAAINWLKKSELDVWRGL